MELAVGIRRVLILRSSMLLTIPLVAPSGDPGPTTSSLSRERMLFYVFSGSGLDDSLKKPRVFLSPAAESARFRIARVAGSGENQLSIVRWAPAAGVISGAALNGEGESKRLGVAGRSSESLPRGSPSPQT